MTGRTIRTRGARIACTDSGMGETAFLFLHYWGGSSRTWEKVIAEVDADARCVAIDQRGWRRSEALDGRFDLDAMADDVEDVVSVLGFRHYVLVGHSMGGKVAQIVAARGAAPPAGLVLVAPAPPDAMPVPPDRRAAMLASYNSRDGVEQAIAMLAGRELDGDEREQVIADTLAGTPDAKREWTERGMIAAIGPRLRDYTGPVRVVVGELDRVERPDTLRTVFAMVLPQATVKTVAGAGHLSPIEVPGTIASHCRDIGLALRTR